MTMYNVHITGLDEAIEDMQKLRRRLEPMRIAKKMKDAVDVGAELERRTHPYTNRTGLLQKSTRSRIMRVEPWRVRVDLEMGMRYAERVNELGYSNINAAAMVAEEAVLAALTNILEPR
jgi:hypothetical protein